MTNATRTIDLEQLATVAGGTKAETAELKQAILGNPDLAKIWQRKFDRYGADDEQTCHMVLMEAFGSINADCSRSDANVYRVINEYGEDRYKINHADVINLCKNYRTF